VGELLGCKVHALHADDKRDVRGQRGINGGIGLRVLRRVIKAQQPLHAHGKPAHRPKLLNDALQHCRSVSGQYGGLVQYYLAYNLHTLQRLKWVAESLVKTL
jgi:hypothetical protein